MSRRHASLGMSSADRWTECTASVDEAAQYPNEGSAFSRLGTAGHQISEECLTIEGREPEDYLGLELLFYEDDAEHWSNAAPADKTPIDRVPVDETLIDAVRIGVNYVREQHLLLGGRLLVEQSVPIAQFTGEWWTNDDGDEESAHGYADVILLGDDWVMVIDLKYGFKPVHASRQVKPAGIDFLTGEFVPEVRLPNLQMSGYTLGAVEKHDPFGEVKRVTMVIVQPFIHHIDSYSCSIEELRKVEAFLAEKAEETRTNPQFRPSYEACYYCRARGRCNAQTEKALTAAFDGIGTDCRGALKPVDKANLGSQYALVDFVRKWAKDVEDAVQRELASGMAVRRGDGLAYKLVAGRNGHRKWDDPLIAEANLKLWGTPDEVLYEKFVITPTTVEKLATPKKPKKGEAPKPPVIDPTAWELLQPHIRQATGKPQIVLETDPRPPIASSDGFEEVAD